MQQGDGEIRYRNGAASRRLFADGMHSSLPHTADYDHNVTFPLAQPSLKQPGLLLTTKA